MAMTPFSFQSVVQPSIWTSTRLKRLMQILIVCVVVILFMPWTQNIESSGKVTTLLPNQRPQEIQAIIGGKIDKWYVREGDFVKKGDTIITITEIKDSYLDPGLVDQTRIKLQAKEKSVLSYSSKIDAINEQIDQLENSREQKLKLAKNKIAQEEFKIKSEIAEVEAAALQYKIATDQYQRDSILKEKGLKSALELEGRRIKKQEAYSKWIGSKNKLEIAQNALENARFDLQNIQAEFGEKLAKAESDRYSTMGSQLESESEVAGLRNSVSNYEIRRGFYTIVAPQDGYVTKTLSSGLGEILKDGASVCTIMPSRFQLAVELYIDPVDMPLVQKGHPVRFVFDGWPTVMFSGWPGLSYGAFPGEIFAIDNTPSPNGKYRVLVAPLVGSKNWPKPLRVGTGARGYLLLNNVSVWYEIWRKLNGFPADYYIQQETNKSSKK